MDARRSKAASRRRSREKRAKLAINLDSVRVLSPDVVMEKGSTTVTEKNGDTSGAQYAAVYVKKDGKWKISQLIETPLADASPHDQLSPLAWLVVIGKKRIRATI